MQEYDSLVDWSLRALGEKWGREFARPEVRWDLKGSSRIGLAYGDTLVRLHPEAARKLGFDQYRQTVIHEVCHIVTEVLRRSTPINQRSHARWSAHGAVWKANMRHLGVDPSRTFRLPEGVALTSARKVSRHLAACGCRTVELTSIRLRRIAAGQTYTCLRCNEKVVPL